MHEPIAPINTVDLDHIDWICEDEKRQLDNSDHRENQLQGDKTLRFDNVRFTMNSLHWQDDTDTGVAVLDMEVQPEIREEKVLRIRRQLAEGRYNVADRLDAVVECLLHVLDR